MCYMKGVIAGRIFSRVLKCVFFGMTAFSVASAGDAVSDKVSPQAHPFGLDQVQLLEGPFKNAQQTNRKYLMALDVDLLSYPFRREAQLPTPVKGRDELGFNYNGTQLGHYLSACALMVRNTGDPELKKRADGLVALLGQCQEKIGTGFVMGFPEAKMKDFILTAKLARAKDGPQNITVPWYSLHKVYAGLLDMYVQTGNRQALEVLCKSIDWLWAQVGHLPENHMQKLMVNEIGGMSELLANLHGVTGKEEYLTLSRRFQENNLMAPLAKGEDPLDERHANSRIPRFVGTVRQYALTADPVLLKTASNFWNFVTKERSYVTGGNSSAEKFSPKAWLSLFHHYNTCETCNSYNMLKLARGLFAIEPDASYADYYERTLYNHILGSHHPQTGGMLYYHQLGNGRPVTDSWGVPNERWFCCYGTGVENHAKYADSIYFHDGKNGLLVNLFIASELSWKAKGLTLRQETRYPEEGATRLSFTLEQPLPLTLKIRRPWWATTDFQIKVNGKLQDLPSTPGSYVALERIWRSGDTLEVMMPMSFRMEGFKDNPKRAAVMYGPLAMAAMATAGNRFAFVKTADESFLKTFQPVDGKPLEFTAPGSVFRTSPLASEVKPVAFKPLFRFVDEPKSLYWDICTPEKYDGFAAFLREESKRQKELEPATVDLVLCSVGSKEFGTNSIQGLLLAGGDAGIGLPRSLEQVSEASHGFEAHASQGDFWRGDLFPVGLFATLRFIPSQSSFSYQMKVLPEQEQLLQLRLWRPRTFHSGLFPESGLGRFEVLVDGTPIGVCESGSLPMEAFADRSFPIPLEMTKGKEKVRVTFRFAGGKNIVVAAGFYECRIVRKSQ